MTDQVSTKMSSVAHPIMNMNLTNNTRSVGIGMPQRKQAFESGFQAGPKISLPQYLHFRSFIRGA
jgi:hypothetical protein